MKIYTFNQVLVLGLVVALVGSTSRAALSVEIKNTEKMLKPSIAPNYSAETANHKFYEQIKNSKSYIQKSMAPAVSSQIRLQKREILDRDFYFEADLQYSSVYDKKYDLYAQSAANPMVLVRFRIYNDELQLVSDNRLNFPSDVNHPEKLISRFKILSQTDEEFVVSEAHSGAYLSSLSAMQLMTDENEEDLVKDEWTRSLEYIHEGSYLLQQQSVMLKSGEILEFMVSVFPKESVNPSKNFKKIEMDPDDIVGGKKGEVARYRFLPTDRIFQGEKKVSYAEHFDIADENSTIDWYVTPNIDDENIKYVGFAVEAWNRYFRSFEGIRRDVLKFKGRLPDGIYLGDPRYNVINWDSRRVAGAAYETQSFDPFSGKQGHSIIYMPAAWLQIGIDYWRDGQFSELQNPINQRLNLTPERLFGDDLKKQKFSWVRSTCARELNDAMAIASSGRIQADDPEVLKNFGRELMKQTLFHEVGHSLGLHHNFKGSLENDGIHRELFSSSIMDYNDFEAERGAFYGMDTAEGPLLEYDRQILSVLYNQSKDVKASDRVMPACNDEEADKESGGVDPLCIRYDFGHDPSESLIRAYQKITNENVENDRTLAQSSLEAARQVLSLAIKKGVNQEDDFSKLKKDFGSALKSAITYYVSTGRSSLVYSLKTDVKMLYQYSQLDSKYDAGLMRERLWTSVQNALSLKDYPVAVQKAHQQALNLFLSEVQKSKYFIGLADSEKAKLLESTKSEIQKSLIDFKTDEKQGLASMRAKVLAALQRHKQVPFFFGVSEKSTIQKRMDFESLIVALVLQKLTDVSSSSIERKASAQTLMSFSGRISGDPAIEEAQKKLQLELKKAQNNEQRELVETLLKVLGA